MGLKAYIFIAILALLVAACSDKGSEPAQEQSAQTTSVPAQPASNPTMPPITRRHRRPLHRKQHQHRVVVKF